MNNKVEWWPRNVIPRNGGSGDLKFGEAEVPSDPLRLARYLDVPWHQVKEARDNPTDYLRRMGMPVYARIGTGGNVVRVYRAKGNIDGLSLVSDKEDIQYFRLDDKSLVSFSISKSIELTEFTVGGLVPVDVAEDGVHGRPVAFEQSYVLGNKEDLDAARALGEIGFSDYPRFALKVAVREDNLWLLTRDVDKILNVGHLLGEENHPYPESLRPVSATYLMFQAAYRLNRLGKFQVDTGLDRPRWSDVRDAIVEFLQEGEPSIFSKNVAKEAAKFVKLKVHRRAGTNGKQRGGKQISLGKLAEFAGKNEISDLGFVSEGLLALMVAADWWVSRSDDPDPKCPKVNPGDLLKVLRSMNFGGNEMGHLIALINGGTQWNGIPVLKYLSDPTAVDDAVSDKAPAPA